MSVSKIIRILNFRQLISLIGWFFKHPLYMICTINATVATFQISQKEFPNVHGLHNKANAFRHALWNALIAFNCSKVDSQTDLVLNWTKNITNWHEDFSPNKELMRFMDLHNNEIGRMLFSDNKLMDVGKLKIKLLNKLEEAKLVSSIEEMSQNKEQLVYLKD